MIFSCWIEYKIARYGGICTTYAQGIADVRDGFWADEDGAFTKTSSANAFVLPHMINYSVKTPLEATP